jgi:hypothetical protein
MIVCIGNGESRKDFDLTKLNNFFTIGCNALYRDFTPNILVCMDYKLCHEVYRSGYAFKNICYFKEWEKIKEKSYKNLFVEGHYKQFVGAVKNLDGLVDEFAWPGEKKKFFVCWANNKDLMEKFKEEKQKEDSTLTDDDFKLHCDMKTVGYTITWTKKKDKIQPLKKYDTRTNAGAISLLLATEHKITKEEIYLLGHDIYSDTNTVNNLYKDTNGYIGKNAKAIDPKNWIRHYAVIFKKWHDTKFIIVNTKKTDEWKDIENINYITYEQFNDTLNLNHFKG